MAIDGPWRFAWLRENSNFPVGVVHLPTDKRQATRLVADGSAISSQTKNVEAAWTFLKFIHSEELTPLWISATGATSIWRSAIPLQLELYNYVDGIEVYVQAPSYGRTWDVDYLGTTDWTAAFNRHVRSLWNGQISPYETGLQIKHDIEAALKNMAP